MDRGSGRSLFKNPPQPFMCIQAGLEGSDDPCFINVLAWEKISQPSHPTHQIPLFGGMKIKNASLNSLAITDLFEGIKNGMQPLIFAVCANTAILKKIGKGSSDEHNRDSLIYVILEFIEAMNSGIKFQYQFKVLPDRDVIGELKDIWFIIQSKRDQEKIELNNAESKRQMLDNQMKDPIINGHWNYRDGDVERKSSPRKEFRHDGNSGLLQYSPHLTSKEYIHTSLSQNGAKNKHVERRYSRENVQSSAMKEAIDWSKRAYTSSHLAQVNYSLSTSSHNLDNISLKPLPPSFNESLEMKARVEKYAAMNHRNKTETVGPKEDKTLLPPFPDLDYPEDNVCNRTIAPHKYTPSTECLHHASISAGPSYHVLNSYESELAMCDQLWHGIATEFPSLDVGRNMQKEDFPDEDDSTLSAAEENDAFSSNILVKRKLLIENIMDSMADLSNDAALGDVSDETLDVQESDLVKELTEYGAIKRNQADTNAMTLMKASQKYLDVQEDMDFASDMSRSSAHDFLDKTKSVSYRPYKHDLSKIPKSNNNIPSFNELNKNIGLSQSNSSLKSLKTDMENFALKAQKDNNDNVDA